ncbi:Fasciclin-like arabinogalactan protein 13, partial [Ananas comosus]
MASTTTTPLLLTTLLLLLIAATVLAQSSAPAPASSAGVNLTEVLEKGGQYTTLIRLLKETQLDLQINSQLRNSFNGLTVFAPTDNAFGALKAGTLNALSPQEQVALVLYHVLPAFYSLEMFQTARNDGAYTLNITSVMNQVNVSTGIVETSITNTLVSNFPLAVYSIEKVLLPYDIFGAKPPAAAPPPAAAKKPANATSPSSAGNTTAAGESSSSSSSSSSLRAGLMKGRGIVWSSTGIVGLGVVAFLGTAAASGQPNVTAVLEKGGQYSTLIRLLQATRVDEQLNSQLNNSFNGLTFIAPTDNAFQSLKPGTLNALSLQQQIELVLFHVLPRFLTPALFATVSNPVNTQASGADGVDTLNITSSPGGQVNISTGVVTVPLGSPLRTDFPLAVYSVETVLLPYSIFGAKPPAAAPAPASPATTKKPPAKTPPTASTAEPPSSTDAPAGSGGSSAAGSTMRSACGAALLGVGVMAIM